MLQVMLTFFSDENFVVVNDRNSGILIFSTWIAFVMWMNCSLVVHLNAVRSTSISSIVFMDVRTEIMYFWHLLFCLQNLKCYLKMWSFIQNSCSENGYELHPRTIHIDFEKSMHNAVQATFPQTAIDCCRFHFGQNWWRRTQKLGLSAQYKDKSLEIGRRLTKHFRIAVSVG